MIKSIQNKNNICIIYVCFNDCKYYFINIPFIESKIKKTDSKTEIIKIFIIFWFIYIWH